MSTHQHKEHHMSYGSITANTVTFNERSNGRYVKAGVGFASPTDEFRLRPSTAVRKDGTVDIAITRVLEKDDTVNDKRVQAVASLTITLPKGSLFTMAEIDGLVADINSFASTATIDEMLQGKS